MRFLSQKDEFWNEKNVNRHLKSKIPSSRKNSENELERKNPKTMSFDLAQGATFSKFCNGERFSNPMKSLILDFEILIRNGSA